MSTDQKSADVQQPRSRARTGKLDLRALWRRKLYLSCWVLGALGLAVGYLVFAKPKYQVSARLLVEESGNPLHEERATNGDRGFLPTQAEIIASPRVVCRTVAALHIDPNPVGEKPAAVQILENLTAAPIVGTNVLTLTFRHEDQQFAERTLEALIASYREFLQTSERAQQLDTIKLLALREQECQAEVARLEDQLLAARKTSPLLGLGRDAAEVQRLLLRDTGQMLAVARNERVQLEYQIDMVTPQLADGGDAAEVPLLPVALPAQRPVGATGELPEAAQGVRSSAALTLLTSLAREGRLGVEDPAPLQQALLEAEVREADLTQRYGDKHPEVQAARRQIQSVEKRLQAAVAALPGLLQRELDSKQRYEEQLARRYDEQLGQVKQFDTFLLQEEQLIEQLRSARAVHDGIVAQLQAGKLVSDQHEGPVTVSVRVLEEPALTSEPLRVPAAIALPLATLFGLLGGVVSLSILGWGGKPGQPLLE